VAASRHRLNALLRLVLLAYVAALAALPFAHHDLACHLKSDIHCAVCHVGTSADGASVQPGLGHVDLTDAGRASEAYASIAATCVLLPSSGRSPPAGANSLL
jgi:hypothetical protein